MAFNCNRVSNNKAPDQKTQELFKLCGFNDANKDDVIEGTNENYDINADLNNDKKIDYLEAQYFLMQLNINGKLNNTDTKKIQKFIPTDKAELKKLYNQILANANDYASFKIIIEMSNAGLFTPTEAFEATKTKTASFPELQIQLFSLLITKSTETGMYKDVIDFYETILPTYNETDLKELAKTFLSALYISNTDKNTQKKYTLKLIDAIERYQSSCFFKIYTTYYGFECDQYKADELLKFINAETKRHNYLMSK